jgi:hypothetical protein
MTGNEIKEMTPEERRELYHQRIAEHTPPKNPHDEFMIEVYRSFLDNPDDVGDWNGVFS